MTAPLLSGGPACRRIEQAFYTCMEEQKMQPLLVRGLLLAFSGGMDSVLLFRLLHAYTARHAIPFACVHVHHGIRGAMADRDAAFCRTMAEAYGIPFFLCRVDALAYARDAGRGKGEENAARELRYAAFREVMAANPAYGTLATAHHATDNLETVLLNLVRGSGRAGMCGIPPVRGPFVRPLLYLSKKEISAAAQELSLSYVTDETNESESYDRNYVRKNILPHLYHLRGNPEAAVTRLCANLREEGEVMHAVEDEAWARITAHGCLSRPALIALPRALAVRLLCRAFAQGGAAVRPERKHLLALFSILQHGPSTGQCPMPGAYHAEFDRQSVRFCKNTRSFSQSYDIPLQMGENKLGEGGGSLWLLDRPSPEFEAQGRNVYNLFIQAKLDSATIGKVLGARCLRAQDTYRFRGMTRRVRRLLSALHLSPVLRAQYPVIYDAQGVLWVPGYPVRDGTVGSGGTGTLYLYYTQGKRTEA